MTVQATVAPPNSVVLVMDPAFGEVPEAMNAELVASTDSCVAIGTLAESDGETTITLSNTEASNKDGDLGTLVFDREVVVSGDQIAVCTILLEPLLVVPVNSSRPRIRVWVNHHAEPDAIRIVVDGPA